MINISNLFHEPFHGIMAPKKNFTWNIPKTKRLEIAILKNLYLNMFLTKLLTEILQFTIKWQKKTIKTLKVFNFITFTDEFHF